MPGLPTGTVTFLFTDIEGSTRLLQQLGDGYAEVLKQYRHILRSAVQEQGGQEVDTQGDAFFFAFIRAREAVMTAVAAQSALLHHPWPEGVAVRARMGLHTGEPLRTDAGYVGLDVHLAARIAAAGHGGQILLSDTTHALVARECPDSVGLRNLGEHRLRDLAGPHRLFQVVAPDLFADFPPLRSLDAGLHNLPIQLTSFIGREREIAQVKALLSRARLVTLTGSGGAGKTRLSLQVAAEMLDGYPDGVWLVELAPLEDPALVSKTVASALSVPEQPGRPMAASLVDALRPKALLIVLDNCEHLLAACADLAAALLRACPQVRLLVTSREGLAVPGELLSRVPSLSLPDPRSIPPLEHLIQYEAVRLFVDRAAATAPGFAITHENAPAVVQVCRRLDGIPLAIELAAARVRVLAVEQIAARLDDQFRLLTGGSRAVLPRHQTLRGAIDWSYNLLSEPERTLLKRLSVFAGGSTLETAEAVCAGGALERVQVLDLLTALVDRSLVLAEAQRDEARYRLLETVRQYGRDRLLESGEAAEARSRHRDWFLALAERAPANLRGPDQLTWLDRFEAEHDNLRAALEWSRTDPGGAEAGLRLVAALWWFWHIRGYFTEGRRWLDEALDRTQGSLSGARAEALLGASLFAYRQTTYTRMQECCEEAARLCRDLGDMRRLAHSLIEQGLLALEQGKHERASSLFAESLALARGTGDHWYVALAVSHVGFSAHYQSDYEQAATCYAEAADICRSQGDHWGLAYNLRLLGHVTRHQGDRERAGAFFRESLAICNALGDRWLTTDCIEGLADVAWMQGDGLRTARLFGAAEASREAIGVAVRPFFRAGYVCSITAIRDALGERVFDAEWARGRVMTLEQAIGYALTGG